MTTTPFSYRERRSLFSTYRKQWNSMTSGALPSCRESLITGKLAWGRALTRVVTPSDAYRTLRDGLTPFVICHFSRCGLRLKRALLLKGIARE